jgi:DNA polymerase-3 subunit beta
MRIVFKKNVLIEAVTYALCAVSNKNTLTSIQGIFIETVGSNKCKLSSFDLEKGMNITVDAEVIEEGSCIINAQRLSQIIRIMPSSEVIISLKGDIASVCSGKSEFEVSAQRGDEFPSIPELDTELGFKIKQKDLYNMVNQTLFAVSQTNQRPIFTGSFFNIEDNKITVVGCDGYRLAVKEIVCDMSEKSSDIKAKVIIPGKTLSELMKIVGENDDEVTIKISKKHVVFELEKKNLMFFSRLLEGEYIDYERLIPKQFNTFVHVSSDFLLSSLERAALVSEENTSTGSKSYVRLKVTDGVLDISSVSAKGKVRDEVSIEKEGNDIEIGFSCRYLIDSIKACKAEDIKLSLASPLISMLMEPEKNKENEKLVMLVLPIKLK